MDMHPPHSSQYAPHSRRRVGPVAAGVAGLGLVVCVVATFLPWVVSGTVSRNSYEVTGLAARLLFADGGRIDVLLRAWPFVGPVCVLPLLFGAFRLWRVAGVLAALVGLVCAGGGIAVQVVAAGSAAGIALAATGPTVLAVGGVSALVGGVLLVARPPRTARSGIATGVGRPPFGYQDGDTAPLPIRRTDPDGRP